MLEAKLLPDTCDRKPGDVALECVEKIYLGERVTMADCCKSCRKITGAHNKKMCPDFFIELPTEPFVIRHKYVVHNI
jgi:hypothetical protein